MRIVWDEPKRRANLEKHGFDFADVSELDWENAVVEDGRPDANGRRRLKAIGYFRDGTAAVVFAILGSEAISIISFRDGTAAVVFAILGSEAISIISFRPASDKERRRLSWPPRTRT